MNRFPHILLLPLLLVACSKNPVTGKSELRLVSEEQELAIGAEQYEPTRQSQGGDYLADPELNLYVSEVGRKLAAVSDRQLPYEFKILNDSIPNAWALPGGKIAVNRGLLVQLNSEAELAAVIGHEITHAAASHTASQMSKMMVLQGAVAGVAIATANNKYGGAAQVGALLGTQLIGQRFGRDAERESDHYGMLYMARAGYDPNGAVELQRTFVQLSAGQRQDWLSGLFASHPPSEERVQNNAAMAATLPAGDAGEARFLAKTAHLRQTTPAYTDYEKGRKALAEGRDGEAEQLAKKALALEPKEGLFHALLGDIEQKRGHLPLAKQNYDRALYYNPRFFYFLLQRGKTNEKLGIYPEARSDLEASSKLLPTADAYNLLGNLARRDNQMEQAKGYYAKAAGSDSPVGKEAFGSLVDLDLPANPGKYLPAQAGGDANGRVVAQVVNNTPRNVTALVVQVQFRDAGGQTRSVQKALSGNLPAGQKVAADFGFVLTPAELATLQAAVVQAKVAQ